MVSAPARPPFYYEPLSNGETSMDPARACGWLVDDLVSAAKTFPEWISEDGALVIDLTVLTHQKEKRAVIGWRTASADGTLTLTADPSGWVKIVGAIRTREVLTAYLERPWEQYEFWPPDAKPATGEEGPGRMGKKQAWVGLGADIWPALAPIANTEGWVHFEIDEDRLRLRMQAEGR
jgi:hypothetical protein